MVSGERPAALFADEGERRLIDGVHVGPLFAVDLDVDEQRVHQRGDLGILEAFMRHHVAPVAGGIADREQDRLVGCHCGGERRRAPGLPMHRVVLVLQLVGAGLVDEGVAVHGSQTSAAGWRCVAPDALERYCPDYTVARGRSANPFLDR